jgi:CRP-like cAMP-binding protein
VERNRLLAALSDNDLALLRPQLETISLNSGDVIIARNTPIEHIYFPQSGIVSSVAVTPTGRRIEAGITGREGLLGIPFLLHADRTPHEAFVQVAGQGLRMPALALRQCMEQSPSLNAMLMRFVHVMGLQVAETALANAGDTIEVRLARWILMCHDRLDGDVVALTHEFLSIMLGVQRPGVTLAIHVLEGEKMIRAARAKITVINRLKLEEFAGDSYGVCEAEFQRLIGWLAPVGARDAAGASGELTA